MAPRYRFLPWARLGAAPTVVDTLGPGVPGRATLPVRLRVNGRHDVGVTAQLHGPGDVASLDARAVVRTDPPAGATEFEPNYFPLVEFDRPDVPWLFTPATGDAQGRLRPWIVLVVVKRQPGVRVELDGVTRQPVLSIGQPARPGDELPDLAESWAWAHAQVVDPGDGTGLDTLLAADSTQNLSRLVCPRRLDPDTAYVACVVPAFADVEGDLVPAWTSADREVVLPVYHRWEFSTGAAGDFESLVRRLTPRPAPDELGARPLSVAGLGFGLPDIGDLPLGGALRRIDAVAPGPLPAAFPAALAPLLDLPAARGAGTSADPVVGPPVYGSRQAAWPTLAGAPPGLFGLNVDPRRRAAAGLGVLVVQDQQEQLMDAAWAQLGNAATRERRHPVFAAAMLGRVRTRLGALSPDVLMDVAGPMFARVAAAPGVTLARQVAQSATPSVFTTGAFRRAVRPQGSLARRRVAAVVAPAPTIRAKFVTAMGGSPMIAFERPAPADTVQPATLLATFDQQVIVSLPDVLDRNARLRAAVAEVQAYYEQLAPPTIPRTFEVAMSVDVVRSMVLAQIDPAITVAPSPPATPEAPATPVLPDLPGPVFPQPMYAPLRDLDPQWLLPGCDTVLPDSVVPLATDGRFVEAYMVGLNHEMSRELLWREYPSDERATPFRTFWTPAGRDPRSYDQLRPLHEWSADSDLGEHFMPGTDGSLVVLVRGELFRRYPGTIVYLTRSTTPGDPASERLLPLFRGDLTADMTFAGFGLQAAQLSAERWFVVFEQQPTEPRFGFDAATTTGRPLTAIGSWNDVSWGDVAATDEDLRALVHVPAGGRLAGHRAGTITWGTNSGHLAAATLQRSFRIALPLTDLVPS